jgi:SAM-dependent methyltransferase
MADTGQAQRFQADRPRDLHERPRPWHRLAFIVRALPEGIERASRELVVPPGGRVLDYGCADLPYRGLFPESADYLAADLPGNPRANVEVAADGTVDVEDASCHAVLSTQVLEHVADPRVHLAECARVLRPGGRLLLSTHGLMVYHPDPVDLWRWTCDGLQKAVADAGLRVVRFEGVMGLGATALQFLQDSFYYRIPLRLRPLLALVLQSLARLVDRYEPRQSKDWNSMVFIVVAERA